MIYRLCLGDRDGVHQGWRGGGDCGCRRLGVNPGGIIGFKKNDNVIIYPQDEYFFVTWRNVFLSSPNPGNIHQCN